MNIVALIIAIPVIMWTTHLQEISTLAVNSIQYQQIEEEIYLPQITDEDTITLEFKEQKTEITSEELSTLPDQWQSTGLTDKHLTKIIVKTDPYTSYPIIEIHFNKEGTDLFANITERNINKHLAIFVNNELISSPIVMATITEGTAIITGAFTIEEVQELAKIITGNN